MVAEVIVDIAHSDIDKVFDYLYDGDSLLTEGYRVIVPFGNRKIEGIVVKLKDKSDYPNLKKIIRIIDEEPAITKENLKLVEFMTATYHVPTALCLRLMLPTEMRTGKVRPKTIRFARLNGEICYDDILNTIPKRATAKRGAVEYLKHQKEEKISVLNEKFNNQSINSLIESNYILVDERRVTRSPYVGLSNDKGNLTLSTEQLNAINSVNSSDKTVSLIHGVTGSGKTEVYLRLINEVISKGKTAIMLVPEIALTPQMLGQLRARFGEGCAILHSGLSAGERFDEWWRLRSGEATIAIGARSAIFAPVENVGIVIIDEEHDASYESETNPRYSTFDLAKFRAEYNNAKLVIGSATPKIESYLQAKTGEYNLIKMSDRINKKPLPEVIIADMREEVKRGNASSFSGALKYELEKTLSEGNQAMIFLNRRGFSQKVICRECGYVAKCENCDVTLTYHKYDNLLKCHYCSQSYNMLSACPSCGSININYSGTGTQKVVYDLKELFPKARILRMDNDTTQNKEGHFKILKEFSEGKADILVGTQMIAKGHDFSNVTLVGILDADMSLYFSDYRSGERTYQLITQVAGRSGRADKVGKVVLQTYSPSNAILKFAVGYDYDGFYEKEVSVRKATAFPPFTNIYRIMVEGEDDGLCIEVLKTTYFQCREVYNKYQESFIFFNKMKSPIKRIKNKFRYQILMRVDAKNTFIKDILYGICEKNITNKVLVYLEENPSNMS